MTKRWGFWSENAWDIRFFGQIRHAVLHLSRFSFYFFIILFYPLTLLALLPTAVLSSEDGIHSFLYCLSPCSAKSVMGGTTIIPHRFPPSFSCQERAGAQPIPSTMSFPAFPLPLPSNTSVPRQSLFSLSFTNPWEKTVTPYDWEIYDCRAHGIFLSSITAPEISDI